MCSSLALFLTPPIPATAGKEPGNSLVSFPDLSSILGLVWSGIETKEQSYAFSSACIWPTIIVVMRYSEENFLNDPDQCTIPNSNIGNCQNQFCGSHHFSQG